MDEATCTSPQKAIKAKCLDCCGWQLKEVKLCTSSDCPLHPFRLGKNPYRKKRVISDSEREAMCERLAKNKPIK